MAGKAIKIRFFGSADLTEFPVPETWIGKDSIYHSKNYNISERDLESLRKRVRQELYNTKNPEREVEKLPFEDPFREKEWVRMGIKNGKFGEYWNPSKLDLMQQYKEENLFVPDNYVSMKDVKKFFGCKATLEKVKEAGFDVCVGRKKGKRGSAGWFVTPKIMETRRILSPSDGVIAVGKLFSDFPNLTDRDLNEIVETNKEGFKQRKFHDGPHVSRQDFVVSTEPLDKLNEERHNPKNQLRSRSITSADVLGNAAKLRKMLREQGKEFRRKKSAAQE